MTRRYVDTSPGRAPVRIYYADCYWWIARFFRGISVMNASGIVQQRAAHDYDRPLLIVSDRRKRKATPEGAPTPGFFWTLPAKMRDACHPHASDHAMTPARPHPSSAGSIVAD